MKNARLFNVLRSSALADKEKSLMSLELLSLHPAGIGDHTTGDFYNNAEEALRMLADAEDRLEMLEKHFHEVYVALPAASSGYVNEEG
ncbi:MAG: hypothetical protein AAF961_16750 [Planctomycetota bacterium]